jgi:Holliday junction resolvase-like predicted endonuclease
MTTAAEMSWDDIKAIVAELAIQSKETDRKMREVFARFDNLSRRFGDLGNRLGEFVEAMVEPALVDLFRARGLDVSEVHRRVTSHRGAERIEIDLLVVDGDTAVAVECKSRLTKEEVERHVERMNKFKRLLPKYADMQVHGAVAGMVVGEDAVEAAQSAGLWVLAQSGETVALKNDPDFAPRVW